MIRVSRTSVFFVTLIIALSLPLIWPFLKPGYFPTHDGEWAVVRFGAMHRALIDNHFPVRWAGNLNFGAGYPLFLFTYPLPYYIGEVFNVIGFGLVGSIKLLFVLSVILSGIGMFLLGSALFGSFGGFLSSMFYLYVPYRLVNLYVRGSLGESLSFALFPFLALAVYKIAKGGGVRWVALLALLFGSLLLMHNVSALLFSPFLLVLGILLALADKKRRKLLMVRLIGGFVLGVLLASFFLLPAIFEKQHVAISATKLTHLPDYFVTLPKLLLPSWGYEAYGQENGLSVQLGWVHLIALLPVVFLKRFIGWFSIASLLLLIFLSLPISLPFWQNVPLFSDVDFPWRVLGPAIFFISLPIGILAKERVTSAAGVGFLIAVIVMTLPYAKPKSFSNQPDGYYFTNEATTTSADELMPLWVKEKPRGRAKEKVEIVEGVGKIEELTYNSIKTNFIVQVDNDARLRINTMYFPGWEVTIDQLDIPVSYDNPQGLIEFDVQPGKHTVSGKFVETPLRLASDILSLIGFLIFLSLPIYWYIFKKDTMLHTRHSGER